MTLSRFPAAVSVLLLALLCSSCTAQKESSSAKVGGASGGAASPGMRLQEGADPVARRLDSLAALSDGDYIHLYVGPCYGRCEGYVSIFRESPAKFHIYEAEGWNYNEFDRADILYRLRRPLRSDLADELIEKARAIGIMKLVEDSTRMVTDRSSISLRARIGGQTLAIDDAYLGGKLYEAGLRNIYVELRKHLFGPLFGVEPRGAGEGK